jgi:large subunit ribosomal protein L32
MAVPKYRTSKSKRDMRRSHHALTAPVNSLCPNCKEVKVPHSVCESCGHYKGKQVIEPRATAKATEQDFTTEG